MSETVGRYEGVVMLNRPPIDKVAALVLLERAFGRDLPIVQFWESKFCTPQQKLEWEGKNLFPIDIGDEKYHQLGVASAAAYVAELFLPGDLFETVEEKEEKRAIDQLVEIINKNNKTGDLKEGSGLSVAWTIRELYELDGYDQVEVIERAAEVTCFLLRVLQRKTDPSRKGEDMPKQLPELWAQAAGKSNLRFNPFSVSRYMLDLWMIGTLVDEIEEKVGWWIEAGRKAQAERNRARDEYQRMEKKLFQAGEVTCIALATVDRPLVMAAGYDRSVGIRVVKNPKTGNAVIAGKRETNLANLAEVLNREEPDLWYYARETQTLINGGPQYVETPSTRFTLEELCALLQQFPPA